jgi:hypothetical protein
MLSLRGQGRLYFDYFVWCTAGCDTWILFPFSLFGRSDLHPSFFIYQNVIVPVTQTSCLISFFPPLSSLVGNVIGRPRRKWKDNIRMDLQDVGCVYVDWIYLAVVGVVADACDRNSAVLCSVLNGELLDSPSDSFSEGLSCV